MWKQFIVRIKPGLQSAKSLNQHDLYPSFKHRIGGFVFFITKKKKKVFMKEKEECLWCERDSRHRALTLRSFKVGPDVAARAHAVWTPLVDLSFYFIISLQNGGRKGKVKVRMTLLPMKSHPTVLCAAAAATWPPPPPPLSQS